MLGLDACELGAQLLELLRLALCARGEPAHVGLGRPRGRGFWRGVVLARGRDPPLPRGNFGGARGPCGMVLPAGLWRGWGGGVCFLQAKHSWG